MKLRSRRSQLLALLFATVLAPACSGSASVESRVPSGPEAPLHDALIDLRGSGVSPDLASHISALLREHDRVRAEIVLPETVPSTVRLEGLDLWPDPSTLEIILRGPQHGRPAVVSHGGLVLAARQIELRDLVVSGTQGTPAVQLTVSEQVLLDRVTIQGHRFEGKERGGGPTGPAPAAVVVMGDGAPGGAELVVRDLWFAGVRGQSGASGALLQARVETTKIERLGLVDNGDGAGAHLAGFEVGEVLAREHLGPLLLPDGCAAGDVAELTTAELTHLASVAGRVPLPWNGPWMQAQSKRSGPPPSSRP